MNATIFYENLLRYAQSHQKNGQPYIGEYQDEKTGYWLKGDSPRSLFYNHSSFCDLIINDLVGLKPMPNNMVKIQPLVPKGQWDWFCLDQVTYHGKTLTVIWDKTGKKYGKGKGFQLFVNGKPVASAKKLSELMVKL